MSWLKFPSVSDADLSAARLQLHEASQIIAGAGISFVEARPDDSHTNLEWLPSLRAFAGTLFSDGLLRAALQTDTLSVLVLDADNTLLASYALDGHTQDEAVDGLKELLRKNGFDASAFSMKKHYEIPETPQGRGEAYHLFNPAAFAALTAYFNNAQLQLERVAVKQNGASDIRLWPHHFDLGLLLSLKEGEDAKSVSMGFSPGDMHYDTPYYYVSPWPYPEKETLSDVDLQAGGFWHTENFIAAILLAKDYTSVEEPEESIALFVDSAVDACKKLLSF